MLLGDGAAFSSGGPGKGLLSRLYTGMMCGSYGIERVGSILLPSLDSGKIPEDSFSPTSKIGN